MALSECSSVTISAGGLATLETGGAGRSVVWLWGEHDVSTVAVLSDSLARAIALNDADVLIDLSGVEFLDAATVSVIVRARGFLQLRSRSLAVRSPSPSARRVLDLCGLEDFFDPGPVGVEAMGGRVTSVAGRHRS